MNSSESTESIEFVEYFCEKSIQICYILCKKPACYHNARKAQAKGYLK